jgi:hypothetical protein
MDTETANELKRLAPHKSVFGLDAPREVTKNLSIPKPVINTIQSWLSMSEPIDPAKLERMKVLQVVN